MNKKNIAVIMITAITMSAVGFLWVGKPAYQMNRNTNAANLDIKAGAALYAQNCAACHGGQLQGQPNWQVPLDNGAYPAPPHDQTGHTWHHDDALLFAYTKKGGAAALAAKGITDFKSGMPGFGQTLSDQDIRNILGFIASRWPERIQKIRAKRLASGGS